MLTKIFAQTFLEWTWVKWITGFGLLALNYVLPTHLVQKVGVTLVGLIVIDWITGLLGSKVSGEKISSQKAGRGAIKVTGYFLQTLLVALAANTFPNPQTAHEIGMLLLFSHIGFTEVKSILENFERMGTPLPIALKQWLLRLMKPQSPKDK